MSVGQKQLLQPLKEGVSDCDGKDEILKSRKKVVARCLVRLKVIVCVGVP